jgi:hypothetical protein
MKITKSQLKQIIKEEIEAVLEQEMRPLDAKFEPLVTQAKGMLDKGKSKRDVKMQLLRLLNFSGGEYYAEGNAHAVLGAITDRVPGLKK